MTYVCQTGSQPSRGIIISHQCLDDYSASTQESVVGILHVRAWTKPKNAAIYTYSYMTYCSYVTYSGYMRVRTL